MRLHRLLLPILIGLSALTGCAYNATGTPPLPTLIFEYSVEGNELYRGNNLAYYLVLNARPEQPGIDSAGNPITDDAGNPERAPLVNGAAPLTFPYPDPRSYLPWVRDEAAVLDREPVAVPNSYWTDFFTLFEEAGQFVMWQGRKNDDGTIVERYRQLQQGREWGIQNNRTIQITVPFNQLNFVNPEAPPATVPANLAVATRNLDNPRPRRIGDPPAGLIDRWGQVQNFFFTIETRPINQNLYDTVGQLSFPQNLPGGVPAQSVNLQTITYRVVNEQRQR